MRRGEPEQPAEHAVFGIYLRTKFAVNSRFNLYFVRIGLRHYPPPFGNPWLIDCCEERETEWRKDCHRVPTTSTSRGGFCKPTGTVYRPFVVLSKRETSAVGGTCETVHLHLICIIMGPGLHIKRWKSYCLFQLPYPHAILTREGQSLKKQHSLVGGSP